MFFLKKYGTGKAKESIDSYLIMNTAAAYQKARETLKARYGNQFSVSDAFRTRVSSWPNIGARDSEGLRSYSDFLNQCSGAKSPFSDLQILNDHMEIQQYAYCLPECALSKWSITALEYKDKQKKYPNFDIFAEFVFNSS